MLPAIMMMVSGCGPDEREMATTLADGGGLTQSGSGSSSASASAEGLDDASFDDTGSAEGAFTDANPEVTTGCAGVSSSLDQVPPTIILLVDQSGSMTANFGGGGVQRWDALYDTLYGQNGVVVELQSAVRFGMTLYTGRMEGQPGECPRLRSVEPAFDNADAIGEMLESQGPLGETPTGESLEIVARALAALELEGPKVILLLTDGEPDTCAQPNPQNGQPQSLAAGELAYSLGVLTYVVSVGNEVGQQHLQQMANVGIGRDRNAANPAQYYQALDPEELIEAVRSIVGVVTSCEFAINGTFDRDRVCEGQVFLDGQPLACNEDWTVSDDSTLTLLGEACETVRDGQSHSVQGTWPCGVVVPIP